MALGFQLSAGSIPGRSHLGSGNLLVGKNNQDAFILEVFDDCVIAIVLDGCGSGKHSEIGAGIGGRVLANLLHNAVRNGALLAVTSPAEAALQFELIRENLLEKLAQIAVCMTTTAGDTSASEADATNTADHTKATILSNDRQATVRLLHDCFLFTIVGFIATSRNTIFFSIGDGIIAVNGRISQLGPFPNNAPPYILYGLFPDYLQYDADLLKFKVHAVVPTDSLESALIATDGMQEVIDKKSKMLPGKNRVVGDISSLWSDDRFFDDHERELITPWLRQLNSEVVKLNRDWQLERSLGLLLDDTTVIALRRKPTRGS